MPLRVLSEPNRPMSNTSWKLNFFVFTMCVYVCVCDAETWKHRINNKSKYSASVCVSSRMRTNGQLWHMYLISSIAIKITHQIDKFPLIIHSISFGNGESMKSNTKFTHTNQWLRINWEFMRSARNYARNGKYAMYNELRQMPLHRTSNQTTEYGNEKKNKWTNVCMDWRTNKQFMHRLWPIYFYVASPFTNR